PKDAGEGRRGRAFPGWPALDLPGQLGLRRVPVRDRLPGWDLVLLDHVDYAPVGEGLDGELSELFERLLVVERAREERAHVHQQRRMLGRRGDGALSVWTALPAGDVPGLRRCAGLRVPAHFRPPSSTSDILPAPDRAHGPGARVRRGD